MNFDRSSSARLFIKIFILSVPIEGFLEPWEHNLISSKFDAQFVSPRWQKYYPIFKIERNDWLQPPPAPSVQYALFIFLKWMRFEGGSGFLHNRYFHYHIFVRKKWEGNPHKKGKIHWPPPPMFWIIRYCTRKIFEIELWRRLSD